MRGMDESRVLLIFPVKRQILCFNPILLRVSVGIYPWVGGIKCGRFTVQVYIRLRSRTSDSPLRPAPRVISMFSVGILSSNSSNNRGRVECMDSDKNVDGPSRQRRTATFITGFRDEGGGGDYRPSGLGAVLSKLKADYRSQSVK